jgi:hypothetical protein
VVALDSARVDGLLGLDYVAFSGRPIPPVALARPTKGWPYGVTSTWPRAMPSHLLVDPGDICPHKPPILKFIFEIIRPKILGPTYGFVMWPDFCSADGCTEGAPNGCSPRALSGF